MFQFLLCTDNVIELWQADFLGYICIDTVWRDTYIVGQPFIWFCLITNLVQTHQSSGEF